MCVLLYFSFVCLHVCAYAAAFKSESNLKVQVHCGSGLEPGASELPRNCTPRVCVPAVLACKLCGGKTPKQNKKSQCPVPCPFLADTKKKNVACHYVSLCRSLIPFPPPSLLFPWTSECGWDQGVLTIISIFFSFWWLSCGKHSLSRLCLSIVQHPLHLGCILFPFLLSPFPRFLCLVRICLLSSLLFLFLLPSSLLCPCYSHPLTLFFFTFINSLFDGAMSFPR